MHLVSIGLIVAGLVLGPTLWVRWMLRRHDGDRPELPHTGGGFAKRLIREHGLDGVTVETTPLGDHYDPIQRKIRLSERNHDRRSITAAATAFHEFGHALQHARGYRPILLRTQAVQWTILSERVGSLLLLVSPAAAVAMPIAARGMVVLGALSMLLKVPVQLITLPVELDASFRRALPLMRDQAGLHRRDLHAARQVLTACALTYVANALWSLLSVRRWLRVLFRR